MHFDISSSFINYRDRIKFYLPCLDMLIPIHLLMYTYKIIFTHSLSQQNKHNFMDIQQAFSLFEFFFIYFLPYFME
jgi:hypothetical protein